MEEADENQHHKSKTHKKYCLHDFYGFCIYDAGFC